MITLITAILAVMLFRQISTSYEGWERFRHDAQLAFPILLAVAAVESMFWALWLIRSAIPDKAIEKLVNKKDEDASC